MIIDTHTYFYLLVQGVATSDFAAKGPEALEQVLWKNALAAYRCALPE